jgi:hypothetical protein
VRSLLFILFFVFLSERGMKVAAESFCLTMGREE